MTTRRHPRARVGALALGIALLAGGAAHADEKRWFEGRDRVFIRQHELFVQIQEPDVHMERARRSFANGHHSIAADELEKAAAGFAYFAQRSGGEDRNQLELAEKALDSLARQIRRGDVEEVTTVDRALADATRVLARTPEKPAQPATPPK